MCGAQNVQGDLGKTVGVFGWMHGQVLERVRGSVGRDARLGRDVSMVRGRYAWIGCTRAKLYGND